MWKRFKFEVKSEDLPGHFCFIAHCAGTLTVYIYCMGKSFFTKGEELDEDLNVLKLELNTFLRFLKRFEETEKDTNLHKKDKEPK